MNLISGALLWRLKAEQGLPLDMSLMRCAQSNVVPTWDELLSSASKDGANIPKLIRELIFHVKEAYTQERAQAICERLERLQQSGTLLGAGQPVARGGG